ncbi:MAG: diacylglycerol kinase family lipid kinase [Chloroflexi bacterium]|nr:diacylglycerol kinase family lipid kinase [Chloroflexota bacterium]MCC6891433.1 diacylglycerol kinase family lipid kinase [Anaerolineae bacterium]
MAANKKVFVIFNPTAGNAAQADAVREALKRHFDEPEWECEVYETTGAEDEDIAKISRKAADEGATIVVSAGGDGTLIGVANGLIHKDIPLGILPLGTGNDLARILNIPLQLEGALGVLSGEHEVFEMDALKVNDCYYFSNVSVGITPHMMSDTKSEQKKRFGRLAYIWTMFKQSKIFQMRHYNLMVDNRPQRVNAVEVMVSNSTLLERFPQLFGSLDTIADGKLELYLVKAKSWRDYLGLAWDLLRRSPKEANKMTHIDARESIRIEAVKHSQLVQADGDAIGHTPVEVRLERKALRVIKPKAQPAAV